MRLEWDSDKDLSVLTAGLLSLAQDQSKPAGVLAAVLSKFGNPHVEYSACRLTVLGYIMLSKYRPRKDVRLATLRLAEIRGAPSYMSN